jgi:predicted nucleic acid-binding protein
VILLDTSVLVDLPELELPAEIMAFSAISYAELKLGLEMRSSPEVRAKRHTDFMFLERAGLEWLPFDRAAGDGYGVVAAEVHRTRPAHARSKDIMIAGHAYSLGASLATLNPKDFELVRDLVPIIVPEFKR